MSFLVFIDLKCVVEICGFVLFSKKFRVFENILWTLSKCYGDAKVD